MHFDIEISISLDFKPYNFVEKAKNQNYKAVVKNKTIFKSCLSGCLYFLLAVFIAFSCSKPEKKVSTNEKIDDIKLLLELSTKVYSKQQNKSLQYALTALELSRKKNDKVSEAYALTTVADIYFKLSFFRKAQTFYLQAAKLYKKQENNTMLNSVSQSIGDTYYKLNISDTALNYYETSLKGFQEVGDRLSIGNAFRKIGNVYWITNNFDKSLEYYLNTLKIYEDNKYLDGLAKVYVNIGLIYSVTDNYDKALEYFSKSKHILETHPDIDILADLFFRMGDVYAKKNLNKLSLAYYDSSLFLLDSVSNKLTTATVLKQKSGVLNKLNKPELALQTALKALKIGETYDNKWFHASIHNTLANLLTAQKRYPEAFAHLNQAGVLAKSLKAWPILKENYDSWSNYYASIGDYKQALNFYSKYHQINDSIQHYDRNERIIQLQTKYDSERNKKELIQKEEEIKQNKKKLQKQKYQLYIFAFGVIVVMMLSVALYRQYKILEIKGKKIERINEELDQRVKERTSALRLTQFSIDQASDPIFWISSGGDYVFVNKSACEKLGYSRENLMKMSVTDIIPNFNQHDWMQFWEIIKKEKSFTFESLHQKNSGKTFPVEIILNYVDHEGNEYAFAYVRDFTDRKQREENLKKAKEKAEEADKLKSAFLANMSHEIRTPMNAIIGFSDLLINDDYSVEEKSEFGNLIKNSGTSLLKLIDDIIDISIMEAGHLKFNKSAIHLNSHLNEIILFFQEEKVRQGKPEVNFILTTPPCSDNILIETDPVRFRQVINNLAGNALKFTDSGTIEIGYEQGKDPILHFYVKDSGIGIRPEKIGLIFERFNKLDDDRRVYAGTGLGLTISKKIIEEMGGFMYVESEFGMGSKFSFTLPYSQSENFIHKDLINLDTSKRELTFNWVDKKILIVEDVDSNYIFLDTVIQKTKAQIFWAKNGKQAVEMAEEIKPSLVLMDIQLPEMSGYEATRLIRKNNPGLPIIAQTAYAFSGEKEKIISAGCNDYITKPIKPKALIEIMSKFLQ